MRKQKTRRKRKQQKNNIKYSGEIKMPEAKCRDNHGLTAVSGIYYIEKKMEKQNMSRVCGLFLFGIGIGLFIGLIFQKTFSMVVVAALCLLAGFNLFCSCK